MKQLINAMPQRMAMLVCGLILSVSAFAQQIVVKGHVKDATGEPITGATVRVAGQEGGVVTDIDGNFSINANAGTEITVSYIGYSDTKAPASANMVIVMKDDAAKSLNEVVVIGYGMVKKSDLTGSVTALKPDSKNKGLVVNPQDMLSGKVAGVNITSDGGAPGAGANIRIRGGSSLNASNSVRKMIRFALDGVTAFSRVPLRAALYVGVLCGGMSFLLILHLLYVYLTGQALNGWTTLGVSILFIGGIQLVGLGIIGEYVGRIFEEVKQRPLYWVKSAINFEEHEEAPLLGPSSADVFMAPEAYTNKSKED